jgi:hypothetical protein
MAVTHISNQAAALQRRPAAIAPTPRSIQDQQATGSKSHPPSNETADEHTILYEKKKAIPAKGKHSPPALSDPVCADSMGDPYARGKIKQRDRPAQPTNHQLGAGQALPGSLGSLLDPARSRDRIELAAGIRSDRGRARARSIDLPLARSLWLMAGWSSMRNGMDRCFYEFAVKLFIGQGWIWKRRDGGRGVSANMDLDLDFLI